MNSVKAIRSWLRCWLSKGIASNSLGKLFCVNSARSLVFLSRVRLGPMERASKRARRVLGRSRLRLETVSPRTMTAMISTTMVTSPRTSQTLIALMVLFLFRQAEAREEMLLAGRGGRAAEDAVAVVAGRVVRVPVHLRVAAI